MIPAINAVAQEGSLQVDNVYRSWNGTDQDDVMKKKNMQLQMQRQLQMPGAVLLYRQCKGYKITPDLKKDLAVGNNWEALSLRGYIGKTSKREIVSAIVDRRVRTVTVCSCGFTLCISA